MSFTYDLTTDVGKVRLLIQDGDAAYEFFSDEEITAYLGLNGSSSTTRRTYMAAADALDSWASNQALILKKVRLLDVTTDGKAVADALRAHANRLRDQADILDDDPGFDIAEMALNRFSIREQILADGIRDA